MTFSSWPVWLAVFTVVAMGLFFIKKPTRHSKLDGHKDTPIHTKPLFKVATFIIILIGLGLVIV